MNKPDLHILMLEDEPLDAELNKVQISLIEEYNCIIDVVTDRKSYIWALENSNPDIILSDYNLPQFTGLEALNELKMRKPYIPLIFVTGTMNEETAAETIKEGASDYVVKDRLFRLPFAVRSVVKLKDERIVAEEERKKAERLLLAIEQTSAQIIVADKNGIIEYVNRKYSEVTGLKQEDVIGNDSIFKSFSEKNSADDNQVLKSLLSGDVYRGEETGVNSNGTIFWQTTSITPIRNEQNMILSYVVVKEDITRQKRMEHQLIEARNKAERSDKLKDAFLQNLSHEIRTPLNAIVGFSEILDNEVTDENKSLKEFTSVIVQSSHNLLSVVTDILTMSSIQTGHEKVHYNHVSINLLLERLFLRYLPFTRAKMLDFSVGVIPAGSEVSTFLDEPKLDYILSNLINNAIKFTESGSINIEAASDTKRLIFKVKDTGIGIPGEAHKFIFERFRQADESIHIKYGGTGLGLSISKSYAEMMKGSLSVESEPGKGSVFTLELPCMSDKEVIEREKNTETIPSKKEITILVAEDDINNFRLIKAYLNLPYVNILHAENGRDSVDMFRENMMIDAVLMDIKMPLMDGIEACKEIKKIRPDVPIIAQTAYIYEKGRNEYLDLGFDECLLKPIVREELMKVIRKCVEI